MSNNILQKITKKPMSSQQITPDILMLEFPFVNVLLVGDPNTNNGEWVLIGAGMAHTAKDIITAAEGRFGKGSQPKAIILSHAHFDHVGAIFELINQWYSPVFAHVLELPYLTGQADYPPADPTVNDGLIAKISPTFPNKGINLGNRVQALPNDGTIPGMPDWKWVHTPGHSPGHVSFYREKDGTLIAGDAITTLKQDSAESVLSKEKSLNGPPSYFTTDWKSSEASVKTLNDLNPKTVISSHGLPFQGQELTDQLSTLAYNFSANAVPEQGRYV